MSINKAYHIIPLSATNVGDLKPLYEDAFGTEVSSEVLAQRFNTEALGGYVIGFMAVDKTTKQVAAYYGVFPIKLLSDGKEILAAQSGDTMTHSAHRKKGLFVHLAEQTFAACKERGISYIFGMPNANSYPGFTGKLGWKCIDYITQYDLKLTWKTVPLRKIASAIGRPKFFEEWARKRLAGYIIPGPGDFTNQISRNEPRVWRNKQYLQYKNSNDKYFIAVGKAIIWVKLNDTLWIGDVDDYSKVTDDTIRQLKRIAFWLGYNTIRFHVNETVSASFLKWFTKKGREPFCSYAVEPSLKKLQPIITAADFDTW